MIDISKFKDIYIQEAQEMLEQLNKGALDFEKNEDDKKKIELMNILMRSSHTLKGSSATMGFNDTAYLSHVMEDIFDNARNDKIVINSNIMDGVFEAIDNLEKSINSIKDTNQEIDLKEVSQKLKEITGVETNGIGKSIKVLEKDESTTSGNDVNIDEVTSKKANEANDVKKESEPNENKKNDIDLKDVSSGGDEKVDSHVNKIDYIKVPVARLDSLMDLVEELVIDKMRIIKLTEQYGELKEISAHLSLLIQSINYEVMQARLVPVEQVFARFPRMVRDLSKKQNKKIEFVVNGGDLELDRSVVDKLGEPLVHLVRNAVDHGIVKEGKINLTAERKRENAIIMIENTDKGIDIMAVKNAAIEKGIISFKEAEHMDNDQAMLLIFHPRLSTNKEVTEISGRGVGLNVVKTFIDSMGGRVVVENLDSGGVRFTLELPLTLAIINSLLVEVNKEFFAIPFSSVERSVSISLSDVKKMGDNEVAVVDGMKVPLLDLRKIFNGYSLKFEHYDKKTNIIKPEYSEAIEQASINEHEDKFEELDIKNSYTAVLIRKGEEFVGFIVDKLVLEQEITVKPLAPILRGIKGFSGSTILGDGKTILILDIMSLLKEVKILNK